MKEYLGEILNQYDGRIVIAHNNNSTNADTTRRKIEEAKLEFINDPILRHRLLVLPNRNDYSGTIQDIQETLSPGDILVAAGGDGTASSAAQAIMGNPDKEVRNTPLLILPGGNANLGSNDLLNRKGHSVSVLHLLAGGEVVDFNPMSLTIYNPLFDSPKLELAFFLSGFGIPTRVENELEKRRNYRLRKNATTRLAVDGISLVSGARKQNKEPIRFSINGEEYEGGGIITANVDRYAKILPTPSTAREAGFSSLIFPDTKLLTEINIARRAILKQIEWLRTDPDKTLEIGIISSANQLVQYDIDAEPKELPFDPSEEVRTRISQKVHNESIKMVSY